MTAPDREGSGPLEPIALLRAAWQRAGYPTPGGPLVPMLQQVAGPVYTAFRRGEADFIAVGWQESGADFPFARSHPRYQALQEAYRQLAQPH